MARLTHLLHALEVRERCAALVARTAVWGLLPPAFASKLITRLEGGLNDRNID